MKCSQCGGTEFTEKRLFVEVEVITNDGGGANPAAEVQLGDGIKRVSDPFREIKTITNKQPLKACVCKKCGHVEFFAK